MRKIFTLVFIFNICTGIINNSFAQVNTQDSLALVSLYNSTNGSSWANTISSTNPWLTGPVSNWYGITLSGNSVASIDLQNNSLSGTIPTSFGTGSLTNLDSLLLGNSPALGNFQLNKLTGNIPASLGNIVSLQFLVLGGNQLSGTIPASLGNLINLQSLDLSYNLLSGSIPYSLGNLTNLSSELYLYNNQLTGSIPGTLGNLVNLTDLELNNNQLSGSISDSLRTLVSLASLYLNVNQLSGNIPSFLDTLFNLTALVLNNNQLTGTIPNLSNLTGLSTLYLSSNQLTGIIPSSLGSIPFLGSLSLSNNQLSGTIPSSLGNSNFFLLDLSSNLLSGTVPPTFGNLTSASTLINNNNLTFDGLEQVITALAGSSGTLTDSPQNVIPLHLTGSILSTYAGGTLANDTFHWYRGGVLDTTIIGDSTFTPLFVGNYSVVVSNKIVTPGMGIPGSDLVLYSDTLLAGMILPVTFLNFTGTLSDDNTALLLWQTATEINASYFNVQRSTDGTNFTDIGKVNAAGNTSGTENYQYTDNLAALIGQPLHLYYRLQEVDKDGNSQFSKIVILGLNGQAAVTIYPNPAKDFLNINLGNNSGDVLIDVVDVNGSKVYVQQQTVQQNSTININTSNFATGVYFLQITVNGSTQEQKFIKQ